MGQAGPSWATPSGSEACRATAAGVHQYRHLQGPSLPLGRGGSGVDGRYGDGSKPLAWDGRNGCE